LTPVDCANDGISPQSSAAKPSGEREQIFYFAVVLWGETFRDLFLNICVPSLLAPSNIPALDTRVRAVSRFLICTTSADANAIAKHPAYDALAKLLTIEFIDIGEAPPDIDRYHRMSQGQLVASRRIFDERAYGIFLCPDAILSDGAIAYMARRVTAGTKVILVPAIRFEQEAVLAELRAKGLLSTGRPLVLSSRLLAAVGLRRLHPETLRYEWASANFASFPVSCFWRVGGGDGIVLHTFSWGPLLIDYGALTEHRTECLEKWTMDGDYVFENFGDDLNGVDVVTDSDALLYLSLTPKEDRRSPKALNWAKRASLRVATYSAIIDPLKRHLFRFSVRLHDRDLDSEWKHTEQRIDALLDATLRPARTYERFWCHYFGQGVLGLLRHVRGWVKNRNTPRRGPTSFKGS